MKPNPFHCHEVCPFADQGGLPFVGNMRQYTLCNQYFRQALWTGCHFQITLMCIPAQSDIGLEMHSDVDQLLYVESGQGIVCMGKNKDCLSYRKNFCRDYSIIIPAGTWHNIKNTGGAPLKLFSVYAPPQHPFGTIHKTKHDAEEDHFSHY